MALDTIRGVLAIVWDEGGTGTPVVAPALPKIATEIDGATAWLDVLKGTGDGECVSDMDGWDITPGTIDVPIPAQRSPGRSTAKPISANRP